MKHQIDVLKHMHAGAIVITPNNRLSQHLIQAYDERFRKTNIGPLTKPLCLSYTSWLEYLFQELNHRYPHDDHPILLSLAQQQFLWRTILHNDPETVVSTELLNLVQTTWKTCVQWNIHPNDPQLQQTLYSRRFQTWYEDFQHRLVTNQAITTEQIPSYFLHATYALPLPTLIWTCFDEFTPVQKKLQEKLSEQQSQQLIDDYQENPINGYYFAAENQQNEFIQAIHWSKERLRQGDKNIAIIVPDLQKQIHSVNMTMARHLAANLYNISYGTPLSEYPIINTALKWLTLNLESLSTEEIHLLLMSPFIQDSQNEFIARSLLLQDNPVMKTPNLPWLTFLEQIKTISPNLHKCLQSLQTYPKIDSPAAWTQHFKQRLKTLAFPGEIAIDSHQYQYLKRFYLLFDDLMSLNAICTSMSADTAIAALKEIAANTVFQIQKPPTPITVLGMLEASGCQYDSIWITGLTDQTLPQKTKLSPFLPIHFQKSQQMPHTDADKEFQRAEHMLKRFGYASNQIILSYPLLIIDQPQLNCSLIENYPAFSPSSTVTNDPICGLETYIENYIYPPKPNEQFSGGTSLLANQAKCPFQAFALHRLKIKINASSIDGLDPTERGQILHHSLEALWTKIGNQAYLLRCSTEEINTMILSSIQTTLPLFANRLSALAQEVETRRLLALIQACLIWEKQRAPFKVAALEASYQITLAGLNLRIRVDRLDQSLHHPSKIIIDYKTSLPASKPWLEERPEAPQLLLYALLDKEIDTLIFMQMKAGKMTLQGLSAQPYTDTGIQTLKTDESWSTYQNHWEHQLTLLAEEIQTGYCEPKPKRPSLCQQCTVHSLCRAVF